jgi:hypothetical protein
MSPYYRAFLNQTNPSFLLIVLQFATDLKEIMLEIKTNGGSVVDLQDHPICKMYAKRLAWKTGLGSVGNVDAYHRACDECAEHLMKDQLAEILDMPTS